MSRFAALEGVVKRWLWHYGFLVIAGLPLLAYEIVAVTTRKVPTVTEDTREFIHKNWWVHVLSVIAWGLFTSHLFANWP